ncbi:uncharacterized protein LOC141684724 isoform X1 [Apium graveolens]|uniref:uncharacterized protein LOC141684724 isoform X1 n=2 Tax=Apium graveolens TaxID=4045 RepID=UPI003D7AD084
MSTGNENEPAKLLLPFLQRADELHVHDPLVAYYCRLYAMERGLKIPQTERTKTTNALLVSLIKQLEKDKKSLELTPDDSLHIEGFALNVFAKADKQDRAGRADKARLPILITSADLIQPSSYQSPLMASSSTTTPNRSYLNATTGLDSNSPYYLHSSDHPGMILITVTLNEHNYNQWSRSMRIALSSKLKLGFVNGTCVKPACTDNLFTYWTRCNDIVISWLLNTVSPEIRQSVMYLNDAHEIWEDLRIRFAQTNIPKLFNLRREIAYLNQGNMSVSSYFTKFRSLNDELDALTDVPRCDCKKCTCSVNEKLDKFYKSTKLSQFLMGLSDQYTAIRGHLLLMSPVPSLSAAYSILMQEESQRECISGTSSVDSSESIALAVKQNDVGRFSQFQSNSGNKITRISKLKTNADSNVICEICSMTGHNKDKCFCVHGYPEWHRLYGKPKPKPKVQNNRNSDVKNSRAYNVISDAVHEGTDKNSESGAFTNAQCQQLMNMIQTSLKDLSSAASHTASNQNANLGHHHLAGPYLEEDHRDW